LSAERLFIIVKEQFMTVETDTTGKTDLKDASGAKHGTDSGMSIYIDPVTGQKIPMKDGKPCRTCIDMKTWKRLGKAAAAKDAAEDKKPSENAKEAAIKSAAETNTTTTNVPLEADNDWRRKNCPPDVEALGSSTWTLLHTMAAYYPERPAPSQMDSMKMFFEGFAQHYPCWFCKVSYATISQCMAKLRLNTEAMFRMTFKSQSLPIPFKSAAGRS
jgi:hypothetical protein